MEMLRFKYWHDCFEKYVESMENMLYYLVLALFLLLSCLPEQQEWQQILRMDFFKSKFI